MLTGTLLLREKMFPKTVYRLHICVSDSVYMNKYTFSLFPIVRFLEVLPFLFV